MTSIVDSLAGTASRVYDGMNRLTSETTPQGTMSYAYDAAGRRSSAQASGGTLTAYTYDNANRVSTVTQGSAQVGIAYDAAGRRTTLMLPNGVTTQYAYDANSRLQSIGYAAQGTSLGSLSYVYDASGRKVEVDGSLAATNLPNPLGQAAYDAANQLVSWDSLPVSYDADGNMTLDVNGNRYAWNSRNQMTGITGNLSAAFTYDGLGRRVGRSVGAQTTAYRYDGLDRITETSAVATTTLLSGALDEEFLRNDNNGSVVLLADGLGSTLGLVNASGQLATRYWYDPYGGISTAGGTLNNTTFTGREDDGTGLMYYRSRYYSSQLGRFTSEDFAGFAGGLNLYQYAHDDPTDIVDPLGLWGTQSNTPRPPNLPGFPTCFEYYGNWGGPCWSGGQWKPLEDLSPEERNNLAQPVDAQDACYEEHDYCYSRSRTSHGNTPGSMKQKGQDQKDCDRGVAACLAGLAGFDPHAIGAGLYFDNPPYIKQPCSGAACMNNH